MIQYDTNTVGHYVAYAKLGTIWLLFDDMKIKTKPLIINGEAEVQAHLCIYIRI